LARRNRRFDEVNYIKSEAMPLLWHAECAELYGAQCDAKFASGRLLLFLRILREVLSNLTPVKRLGKQFPIMLAEHPVFRLDELRIVGQKLDGSLAHLRD